MRAVFAEHEQDVDLNKLRRYGITEIVVPTQDSPLANADKLQYLKDQGFKPTLFVAWNWFPGLSGTQFAEKCDAELKRIGWGGNPHLQADIEKGAGVDDSNYVDYVVSFVRRWRQLRPTRETSWTLESMQGGLFNGRYAAVQAILASAVRVVPQFYDGTMKASAQDVALKDLMLYGFPAQLIRGYYDAAALPANWDGYAWTSGRLP